MKIPHPKILTLILLGLWLPHPDFSDAQTTPFPAGQPIETRMDLGLFGLLGGGMNYTLGGQPIYRYEDFKAMIYPLRDAEASDLIREADETHDTAWLFYITGTAVGADIALFFKPATSLWNVDWFDRVVTGLVVAEIPWGIGALFDNNAEGRKYNAVQRYNQLVRQKNQAFLDLKPEVALDFDGPRLGLGCDF